VWAGGRGKGCKFLKGQWERLYDKSEYDKALQPSVEVTGPSTVMNLEKQTLTFTFRKLLQLSESKHRHPT